MTTSFPLSISDIDILSDNEKKTLLYDFNNTKADYPKDKCVHQLFEEQVAKTPDKIAVIARDKMLTYAELNEQANRIANALIAEGVKVGDIVAFALPRKSYLIATMLGILKAGAAYLPIDPNYPQDRIDYMLEDSKAKFFINENNIKELLDNTDTISPNINMSSHNLCYCIYTSGSTGNPKATGVYHFNAVNFCTDNKPNNLQHHISLNCSNILACGAIVFDIFNFETMLSLLLNKTIILASEEALSNVNMLADLVLNNNVDCIHCTPTKLQTYLDNQKFDSALVNVKCVMLGGETLTSELCEKLRSYSCARLFNGYGPTETTMGVSFGEIN